MIALLIKTNEHFEGRVTPSDTTLEGLDLLRQHLGHVYILHATLILWPLILFWYISILKLEIE